MPNFRGNMLYVDVDNSDSEMLRFPSTYGAKELTES